MLDGPGRRTDEESRIVWKRDEEAKGNLEEDDDDDEDEEVWLGVDKVTDEMQCVPLNTAPAMTCAKYV